MPSFVVFAGVGLCLLSGVVVAQTPPMPPPPPAPHHVSLIDTQRESPTMPPTNAKHDVTDTYHDVVVHDPYRWLEDADAPATKQWIAAQNAHTEKVMDGFKDAAALAKRVGELALTTTVQFDPQIAAGTLFYMRQTPPQPHAVLVAASWPAGTPKVLVDPNAGDGGIAITGHWPSPDARRSLTAAPRAAARRPRSVSLTPPAARRWPTRCRMPAAAPRRRRWYGTPTAKA